MAAEIFVHNLDPFLIEFPKNWSLGGFHPGGIRWYGMAYLMGFLLGYLAIRHMAKRGTTSMKAVEVADFVTLVAVGTMVGGRLGYCLFYAPNLLWDFSGGFPYWGVLRVHEGGMASHGGILGIIAVCLWWARSRKTDPFHVLDLVVFGGSLGIFFGRIANFINGELYGREAPASLSWAVKFPQEIYTWPKLGLAKLETLTPAVQALGEVQLPSGGVLKLSAETWTGWLRQGQSNYSNYVMEKLIEATQSGNQAVLEALGPVLTPRYPSQLIQALLEGLLVFVVLSLIWLKPRKPGVVSAWFGILYAVARIIGEQFRMPDAHIGFQWLGLTRGQWLSVAMLGFIVAYFVYVLKRKSQPTGGWGLR